MTKKKPDYKLIITTGLIVFFGIFALASASTVRVETSFVEQLLIGIIPGIIIALVLFKIPLSVIQKLSPYALLFNLAFVFLLFIPFFSISSRGATRWIDLGLFTIQPTEFLKLTVILYLASFFAAKKINNKKKYETMKSILFPFLIFFILLGIIFALQPDFSTFLIILCTGLLIYFVADTPLWHTIIIGFLGGVGALAFIWYLPYGLSRIVGIINGLDFDPTTSTHHISQSLIGIGSGGIFGVGIGMSQQKFGFLPFPASDSIFAVIAEETGFIGATILLLLFLGFFWRGFVIAKNSDNKFCRLAAFGIVSWIFIQASVNIGVMLNILPATGMPLPFISYGKSHLIAEFAALGVLLNISQYISTKRKKR